MPRQPKRPAIWVDCPGMRDGRYAHAMRDGCWSCAPFWETLPTCPDDGKKLSTTGYCKQCRKHFALECQHTNVARPTAERATYHCNDCNRDLS